MSSNLPLYLSDSNAVFKQRTDNVQWRNGIPNYSKVDICFEKYKMTNHQSGSVEFLVQNLIKNWEKEVTHIKNPNQWSTVDPIHHRFSCNGQQKFTGLELVKQGTYNALIGQTNYYDSNLISFEESHAIFKKTLGEGFAWEVLEVYSSPPMITFTWRHFGKMTDYFSCPGLSGLNYKVDPTNKMIKLYGMCKMNINTQYQIQDLQVFYDPNQLFTQLTEISPFAPFARLDISNVKKIKDTNENNKQKQSAFCNII